MKPVEIVKVAKDEGGLHPGEQKVGHRDLELMQIALPGKQSVATSGEGYP
jgi:hypothetical protein